MANWRSNPLWGVFTLVWAVITVMGIVVGILLAAPFLGPRRAFFAVGQDEEFDGDDFDPLMQQLEEGMLARRARLAPGNAGREAIDRRAIARHALAVRFHFELLEIGGQLAQPPRIGRADIG